MSSFTPADLESRVPVLMGVLIGTGAAATIAVIGRFIARGKISRNLGWDDWTMLIAVVSPIPKNNSNSQVLVPPLAWIYHRQETIPTQHKTNSTY